MLDDIGKLTMNMVNLSPMTKVMMKRHNVSVSVL